MCVEINLIRKMKDKKSVKTKKSKPGQETFETKDPRFADLNDPRFIEMPKKKQKVKIDKERFGGIFKKNEFNVIGKFDKTGKVVKERDRMMQKYYRVDDEDDEEPEDGPEKVKDDGKAGSKFYDEEGNFNWDPNQAKNASSSSSDESGDE